MEQPQAQVQGDSTTSSLDPQAVNLAKAIRQTETGGNFTAKGKSGEYGAYQFTEPTWNTAAKKYGVNIPLEQATPEQQNEVAYKQIKEWKDAGYNVGQIASLWNSGKPDAYLDTEYKGQNKFGVSYDVPAYAKSVATAYQTIKNGGEVSTDENNPSSVVTPQFPLISQKDIGQPSAQTTPTTPQVPGQPAPIPGIIDQAKNGDYLGAASSAIRKFGSALTGGGTESIGQSIGTLGGYGYEKLKGLLGGQDNSASYNTSAPSVGNTIGGAIKTIASATGIEGSGNLLSKLGFDVSIGGSALGSNLAQDVISQYAKSTGSKIAELSKGEVVNALAEAARSADAASQPILQQASKEALNQYMKEQGIGSFSELNPKTAKVLGLSKTALKYILGGAALGVASKASGTVGKALKGLIP